MHRITHWQPAPDNLDIASDALDLWRIRTDEAGLDLGRAVSLLSERQQLRVERMRHRPYRERYVRAQAGLRLVLARYLKLPPEAICFTYGPAGKPDLPDGCGPLSFNLTTTGDLALIGLSGGGGSMAELGVDCERIRPRIDVLAVARRMFDSSTVASVEATPEPERLAVFYRAWTAYEADAKADGRGLFRERAIGAIPPEVVHFIPQAGYIAAVARAMLPPVDQWRTFDLQPPWI